MTSLTSIAVCRAAGPRILGALVDPGTGRARFNDVQMVDSTLRELGFRLVERSSYGPPGGRQLYYRCGLVVVRIKTRGEDETKPFRSKQPHMSVSLMADGKGLEWHKEKAKFNAHGQLSAKAFMTPGSFQKTLAKNVPPQWYVIQGGRDTGPGTDAWADRVHFHFPTPFCDAAASSLVVEPGA